MKKVFINSFTFSLEHISHRIIQIAEGEGGERSRTDCSLTRVTKKFLELVNKAQDGVVDLNTAADALQVNQINCF